MEELPADRGLPREALNSLYSIFGSTREILKDAGPDVGAEMPSIGGIAIRVVNHGLRPFLSKWHAALSAWEEGANRSGIAGAKWDQDQVFRADLDRLRKQLSAYAHALGVACGVED